MRWGSVDLEWPGARGEMLQPEAQCWKERSPAGHCGHRMCQNSAVAKKNETATIKVAEQCQHGRASSTALCFSRTA